MAITTVVFVVVAITFCVALPITTEFTPVEVDEQKVIVAKDDEVELVTIEFLNDVVMKSDSEDKVRVRRTVIDGHMCPIGEGLAPSGECAPCRGQKLPGCPDVAYEEEDYENDV